MIENLKTGNALGTAHIYQASKNAFITFLGKEEIHFRQIKPELLKRFEYFLRSRGNSWNTVSTYMRVLRAVYNRAVDRKLAPYMPRLFKKVYTGTRTDIKRALRPEDMGRLLNTQSTRKQTETLRRTHQLFVLMFLLRGLPFVDLAYLQKTDLDGNTLTYHRHKTGSPLTVTVPKEAMDIIDEWKNTDPDATYLFPILEENEKSQDNYRYISKHYGHSIINWQSWRIYLDSTAISVRTPHAIHGQHLPTIWKCIRGLSVKQWDTPPLK